MPAARASRPSVDHRRDDGTPAMTFRPAGRLKRVPATDREELMNLPPVVSTTEWQEARDALLAKEKEATRARDALAAERRRLPMVRFDNDYIFDGPDGKTRLL